MMTDANPPSADTIAERHYTPAEIAEILKCDPQTVTRMFRDEPGVIEFGSDERLYKRKRKFMRIPHSVFVRFHEQHRTARRKKSE